MLAQRVSLNTPRHQYAFNIPLMDGMFGPTFLLLVSFRQSTFATISRPLKSSNRSSKRSTDSSLATFHLRNESLRNSFNRLHSVNSLPPVLSSPSFARFSSLTPFPPHQQRSNSLNQRSNPSECSSILTITPPTEPSKTQTFLNVSIQSLHPDQRAQNVQHTFHFPILSPPTKAQTILHFVFISVS